MKNTRSQLRAGELRDRQQAGRVAPRAPIPVCSPGGSTELAEVFSRFLSLPLFLSTLILSALNSRGQSLPAFTYPFVGTTANDGTGTPLRSSLSMINTNFTNLYVWLNTNGVLTLTMTNDTRALSLTNSGSILWGTFTGIFNGLNTNSIVLNGGASAPSIALLSTNATPATNSVQQAPGALQLSGQGYQTGTSHSRETDLRIREQPIQGGAPSNEPGVQWLFDSQVDLGGWTNDMTLDWLGNLSIPGGFTNAGPVKFASLAPLASLQLLGIDSSGNVTAATNGGALGNLTATNLVGTVPDANLSGNIPRLGGGNTFLGPYQIFNGVLAIPNITAGLVPLGVLGAGGQVADLQDWLSSSGVKLAGVTSNGVFTGNAAGLTNYPGSLTQPLLASTVATSNGFASYASQATLAIAATGITNAYGIGAGAYLTCSGITSYLTNAVGQCVKTNTSATYVDQYFHLQPGGCLHAASGLSGTLIPE
jgi:hypothetical protein